MALKIGWQKAAGTKGRKTPDEESSKMKMSCILTSSTHCEENEQAH
jgi:hypothetical protein